MLDFRVSYCMVSVLICFDYFGTAMHDRGCTHLLVWKNCTYTFSMPLSLVLGVLISQG